MRRDFFIGLGLILAVFAVYGQTVGHDFLWFDDRQYILLNPQVQRGLSWAGVCWASTSMVEANWHPLTWLSHMLDVTLWGNWAGGHHLTNVLIHAANSVLVFGVLRRLSVVGFRFSGGGSHSCGHAYSENPWPFDPNAENRKPTTENRTSPWPAAWVAAVFALHPLHVESVAWIAERKDVLCAFFFLLALLAYARYCRLQILDCRLLEPGQKAAFFILRSSKFNYLLTLLCFALALLSKPMAVTLPFVLLLVDWWPLGRLAPVMDEGRSMEPAVPAGNGGDRGLQGSKQARARGVLLEKLPFFAMSAASCVVTLIAQRGAMAQLVHVTLTDRLGNALTSYVAYLHKFLWPVDLCALYPYRHDIPILAVFGAGAVLAGLTAVAGWRAHRRPYLMVGWLWFLGMLVPVIGLVQVGEQAMADRYTYLPSLGLCLGVAWGLADVCRGRRLMRLGLGATALASVVICVVLAFQQTQHWRDTVTLFRQMRSIAGPSERALVTMAGALAEQKEWDASLHVLEEAHQIGPNRAQVAVYKAIALKNMGRPAEAVEQARAAVAENANQIDAYGVWGASLVRLGRAEEAVDVIREGIRRAPDTDYLHLELGLALMATGRGEEGLAAHREALRLNPQKWLQRLVLADALRVVGQLAAAGNVLVEAERLCPATSEARAGLAAAESALGKAFASKGDPTQAVAFLRSAVRLAPRAIEPQYEWVTFLYERGNPALAEEVAALGASLERDATASPEICNDVAWMLATHPDGAVRNGPLAVTLAWRAAEASAWNQATILDTLAAAEAEVGHFDRAGDLTRRAIALLTTSDDDLKLLQAMQQRLILYEARSAYRESPLALRVP